MGPKPTPINTTKRNQILNRFERIKSYVDNFNCDTSNRGTLKPRLTALQECWQQFNDIEDISEDENHERAEFESNYFNTIAKLEEHLNLSDAKPTNVESKVQTPINLKLPTIDLPNFSGDYAKWLNYRDLFQSLIHINPNIGKIEKFYYLKSSLSGEASSVISNLEVSAINYEAAWNLLIRRYDNNRLIVNHHVNSLFGVPKIDKPTGSSLRKLIMDVSTHLRALESLNQPVSYWDTLIVYLVATKLDYYTLREWEQSLKSESPTWNLMYEFLEHRCQALETTDSMKPKRSLSDSLSSHVKKDSNKNNLSPTYNHSLSRKSVCFTATKLGTCGYCSSKEHALYGCPEFKALNVSERNTQARRLNVCLNCLRSGHSVADCRSSMCKMCGKKHNTSLHVDSNQKGHSNQSKNQVTSNNNVDSTLSYVSRFTGNSSFVLLPTVVLNIQSSNGKLIQARALLDSCSQSNFISERLVSVLQLKRTRTTVNISGIGVSGAQATSAIRTHIYSRYKNYEAELDFLVLRKISPDYPHTSLKLTPNLIPRYIQLADEDFHRPRKIDLLLGAEIFYEVLDSDNVPLNNGSTILRDSKFGWIVTGKIENNNRKSFKTVCNLSISENSLPSIHALIERFWAIEERPVPSSLTHEEKECEDHFNKTVYRNHEGRFVVTLPIKENLSLIGSTRHIASKRLYQVTRKLESNPLIKSRYYYFMQEYLALGHMKPVPDYHVPDSIVYHIPHHSVHKEDSTSTKLRVVFNASTKGSNGLALNECLMAGPVVQDDLFSITVRFRQHQFALVADITKMYRQVLINPNQYDLQRILWWDDTKNEKEYWLVTLTYGTTPASFLATRCLVKLAEDEKTDLPLASQVLRNDFYVDDMISGCDTIAEGLELQSQMIEILNRAGMQLSKWGSNSPELLSNIPEENRESASAITFHKDEIIKTLGSYWNPDKDTFLFRVLDVNPSVDITKRIVLSDIARLFDPLGLVAPVIVKAKILMQRIWQKRLSWDDLLPAELQNTWKQYRLELHQLTLLNIPRCIIPSPNPSDLQIHGFCDASEIAYGACLYLRSMFSDGTIITRLIAAKSRVAPLKSTTIPRLELCGALLLAELADKTCKALKLSFTCHYWTDSTIVLGWLNTQQRLKTYVSNRIAQILELSESQQWNHVLSECNPADILSRGATPKELSSSNLWWNGPNWLSIPDAQWQSSLIQPVKDLPEIKIETNAFVASTPDTDFITRCSNLRLLLRYTAWWLRFIRCCKDSQHKRPFPLFLESEELHASRERLIHLVQADGFQQELYDLKHNQFVGNNSRLRSLAPFVDANGLLRVGGRLQKAESLEYDQKHPVLLPANHHFTKLVIRSEHINLHHAGPQATLAAVRLHYWPLNGKNISRKIFHQCIRCFRSKNHSDLTQLMGDLPMERIAPLSPFVNTGVDYCGPINVKTGFRKNCKLIKAYVSVFVCLSTKAVHLELVHDLTSESFISALKRFIGRRGKCEKIFSDNATTFTGANKQLQELRNFFLTESNSLKIYNFLSDEGIKWVFSPPRAPHHNGLMEAAVKSMKTHLKRVMGNSHLNSEELNTLLISVEAILNSRPLYPSSSDPNDLNPLTPAHFLIGRSLTAALEPDLKPVNISTLSRWQRIQQLTQSFWTRWKAEYLCLLQNRTKWSSSSPNVKVGTMVLIKEDNVPPLCWPLGRIEALHPGQDGLVRVVTVKSANGLKKRPIVKIAPLPMDEG